MCCREGKSQKDIVSRSHHSLTPALRASNKPLIVGEHELFLLRGWQALDLRVRAATCWPWRGESRPLNVEVNYPCRDSFSSGLWLNFFFFLNAFLAAAVLVYFVSKWWHISLDRDKYVSEKQHSNQRNTQPDKVMSNKHPWTPSCSFFPQCLPMQRLENKYTCYEE